MIAVIADDFTGAAEISGMGLRRGLKVLIETSVSGSADADLLIIAMNTRSMMVGPAQNEVGKVTKQLLELSPKYIFKKLDSVLRGNIYEELVTQQIASGKKRAIVVAANPHFNRIIRNGIYSINGIPLAETFFAHDPEFPVKYSHVKEIIGKNKKGLYSMNVTDNLPGQGIIIGNVVNEQDLVSWAGKVDDESLVAGGSGFFEALLQKDFPCCQTNHEPGFFPGKNALFIFGSTYPKETVTLNKFREAGVEVINLSGKLFNEKFVPAEIRRWSDKIAGEIRSKGEVAITTIFPESTEKISASAIRNVMGQLIKEVLSRVQIDDLFIEGGATAFQILNNLGIRRLIPFRELDFGIIQMHVAGFSNLSITTKPGSYMWPDFIISKKRSKLN